MEYAASQEVGGEFPQIPPQDFARSVQLVLPGGTVLSGARAVAELFTCAGKPGFSALYKRVPGFAAASELGYRFIAAHRNLFYWLTVLLFGKRVQPASYIKVEWLFRRALALIYLAAFASLGVQVRGLIGSHGILPVGLYLNGAWGALGPAAWHAVPTLFWLSHGDAVLTGTCIAGVICSLVLLAGLFERTCLAILFILYLSLCAAGQDFLSFQWDMLLLETGFLAIFLESSGIVVWLYRLLVFRLMFSSGMVKLLSGDPSWRDLTALAYHYFTQPLPTPVAWYYAKMPAWFHTYSTAAVFVIELAVPFLVFLPRRPRMLGAWLLIFLQGLILTTGNYAFFNWLSIALCLFLFDDAALPESRIRRVPRPTPRWVTVAVAVIVILLGALQMTVTFGGRLPAAAAALVRAAAPFGIVNTYGLFAVMTTARPEITVQGSNDGVNWLDYEFKYKPGPLNRPPPWVAPHQPRLDWQMWFAALGTYRENPWFVSYLVRLLEGSPDVMALMAKNPFPASPPRYVRALISLYQFTNSSERRATGNWWKAGPPAQYVRAISLDDVRRP